MEKNEKNGQNSVATNATEKNFTFTFATVGGPQRVEITDEKIVNFIKSTKYMKDNWGEHPKHPFDFIEIANQLYWEDMITEQDRDYYNEKFSDMVKKFKYSN